MKAKAPLTTCAGSHSHKCSQLTQHQLMQQYELPCGCGEKLSLKDLLRARELITS